jgi:2-polyprenyl-3-methyl-5-hydroxy-6-metoxy-1,4-benzoquinol methylase
MSLVLDYGCGIGRLSKAPIARHGCNVVGVDISPSMRSMAVGYVDSERFSAWSREELDEKLGVGVAFDLAIWVRVLQHYPSVQEDVARIGPGRRVVCGEPANTVRPDGRSRVA